MKCENARILMVDLHDGNLPAADRQLLEAHLASCPDCNAAWEAMRSLPETLRGEEPWSPPQAYFDSLLPRIHERIETRAVQRQPLGIAALWLRRLAIPAACILILLVTTLNRVAGPAGAGPATSDQDVAGILQQLPVETRNRIADQAEIEAQFNVHAADSQSELLSGDDANEVAQLITEDSVLTSVMPETMVESDPALLASNDEVFDVIRPALDQAISDLH